MNYSLITLEVLAVLMGLIVLLADLWVSPTARKALGLGLAAALGCLLAFAVGSLAPQSGSAFADMFVVDDLARYFKGFFLFAALAVVLMAVDYAPKFGAGLSEFFALTVFALVGMLFAASANDLVLLFVSLELITVTFFVLNSFQRTQLASLEAGVKYLILGGVSSAFMVFGIALIFGTANSAISPCWPPSRRNWPTPRCFSLDCCSFWWVWVSRLPQCPSRCGHRMCTKDRPLPRPPFWLSDLRPRDLFCSSASWSVRYRRSRPNGTGSS